MGSFKNKINNNKKKKMENATANELIKLKKQMKEQYAAGEYVEAMDTMAEIAQHKKMDPEIMSMGAQCYFMTGDYERATKWVNNTLTYDPNNISARLLLGRLCFVEDKPQDGFAILTFVIEKMQSALKDEDKEVIMEMLGYCHDNMGDMMTQYPVLENYYNKNHVVNNTIHDQLEATIAPNEGGKTKAQAAVDRLKSLLHKSKGGKDTQKPAETTVSAPVSTSVPVSDGPEKSNTALAAQLIEKVMSSDISLRDKIKGLNNFASGLYLNDDYDGAIQLLNKALEIDAHDPFVLRNIAYVCLAMKDKDKALEYASKLPMMDFGLIKAIKGHCHG